MGLFKVEPTWNESQRRNNQIANPDLEQLLPSRTSSASKSNLLEHDILVEVDAVESDIE